MWRCEICRKDFSDSRMAIELRFGYIDGAEAKGKNQDKGK